MPDQHTLDKGKTMMIKDCGCMQGSRCSFHEYEYLTRNLSEQEKENLVKLLKSREQEMLEFVIGETEVAWKKPKAKTRNDLKSEQRQRAKEWREK